MKHDVSEAGYAPETSCLIKKLYDGQNPKAEDNGTSLYSVRTVSLAYVTKRK
jgi:hypothetical protein